MKPRFLKFHVGQAVLATLLVAFCQGAVGAQNKPASIALILMQQQDAAEEQQIYAAVVRYQRHFSAEDNTLLFVSLYGKSATAAFLRPLQDHKRTLRPTSQMTYAKRNPSDKIGRIPADKRTGKHGGHLNIQGVTWETSRQVKVHAYLFTGGIDGMRAPYIVIKEKGQWHVKPYEWK